MRRVGNRIVQSLLDKRQWTGRRVVKWTLLGSFYGYCVYDYVHLKQERVQENGLLWQSYIDEYGLQIRDERIDKVLREVKQMALEMRKLDLKQQEEKQQQIVYVGNKYEDYFFLTCGAATLGCFMVLASRLLILSHVYLPPVTYLLAKEVRKMRRERQSCKLISESYFQNLMVTAVYTSMLSFGATIAYFALNENSIVQKIMQPASELKRRNENEDASYLLTTHLIQMRQRMLNQELFKMSGIERSRDWLDYFSKYKRTIGYQQFEDKELDALSHYHKALYGMFHLHNAKKLRPDELNASLYEIKKTEVHEQFTKALESNRRNRNGFASVIEHDMDVFLRNF